MKFKTKFSMFLTVFIILGCSLTAISANEDIDTSDVSVLEETNTISNFTDLQNEINTNDVVNLTSNVTWQKGEKEITIINKTITIEGYGYTIDACNNCSIFKIKNSNVILKNVNLCNSFSVNGGAFYPVNSTCDLINCTFSSNVANQLGAAILSYATTCNIYNCTFCSNVDQAGAGVYIYGGDCNIYDCNFSSNVATVQGSAICIIAGATCNIYDCNFSSNVANKEGSTIYISTGVNCNIFNSNFMNTEDYWSSVYVEGSNLSIYDSNFYNLTSNYASAIGSNKANIIINNSKFKNLKSNMTAGAIGVKDTNFKLSNCEFINTTSTKNGGAIYIDVYDNLLATFNISSSSFTNCSSEFGGAITILNNRNSSVISDCNFTGNIAKFNGGAIYTSYTNLTITGSNFRDNKADCTNQTSQILNYGNGGALYLDASETTLLNSILINNLASSQGGAIYTYDGIIVLNNTNSSDNSNENSYGVYNVFLKNYTSIDSNINDTLLFNSTYYVTVVGGTGAKLTLINDSIVITNYTKFDLRDYGWVTPVKNQGKMGSCWAFATCAAIESALLKKTNTTYILSENNMKTAMIQSSPFGTTRDNEGGNLLTGIAYAINWLGIISSDYDAYDELGKLSPIISTENNIHIQDVLYINNRVNATDNSAIKEALMKYGAIAISYYHSEEYYNNSTHAYYYNGTGHNHAICIVGWDDNYSKDNFIITPPGDGAFIVKNSWGSSSEDDGYLYMSYYNTLEPFIVFIINNTTPYNKNYQLDFSEISDFNKDYSYYSNRFTSCGNDSIAAVGTYFIESGVNYEFKVYINDELKHTQVGLSPFGGYSTIPLSKNITVCENDNIRVVMKSNRVPFSNETRVHLASNSSFVSVDGENWTDLATFNTTQIACLKVYTVEFDLKTSNLTKYYGNDSKFTVDLGGSNLTAIFNINGVNYTRISNESGIASLTINLNPGEYNITTSALGKVNLNTVNVLSTINGYDVTKIFKNSTQFIASFTDSMGNILVNKTVQFNINGVIYTKTTDSNGTASLNINLNPGEYIITSINGNESKANNITVLSTIVSSDIVKYYLNGTQYSATFYDSNNNSLVNQTVQFNINGVFYTRTTDSNGVATLNINLQPGNYIVTAISPNGESKANNILVKSVLIGEDLNKTVTEAKAYEVMLVDGEGTPFAGEEVIMNINGVFYNKTTDNGGIARLNINLGVGDYIITTSWNGTYTNNKINVRS